MTRNTDLDALFDSADAAFANGVAKQPARPVPQEERHKCIRCLGSGKYRGPRVHQSDDTCFACGGRGWHKKSYADRMASKAKRDATISRKYFDRQAAMKANHPAVAEWISMEAARGFGFAQSLQDQMTARDLTENQIAAVYRCIAKRDAARAEKAAQRASNSGNVEVARIRELFDTALSNGLKKPVLRAEGLALKLAGQHSKNAGAIYVTKGGEYVGKIVGTQFMATREADATVLPGLQAISTEPKEAAIRYGRLTGSCACCGRELTDPNSIAMGIGPICASKWF
jgi:hypothetical protein